MKKRIFSVLVLVILCSLSIFSAMAEVYTPETNAAETEAIDPYSSDTSLGALLDESAEKATVDNIKTYVDNKGGQGIFLLQYAAEPFLVIAFICFVFMLVLGIFGNGELVGKGIFGMLTCGIAYSMVLYAPEIMGFISGFAAP